MILGIALAGTLSFAKEKKAHLDWDTSIGTVRVKSSDGKEPVSVYIRFAFGYEKGDKTAPQEIAERRIEIIDFLRRHLSSLSAQDFLPKNEGQLTQEICNQLNKTIMSDSRILDVRILEKTVEKTK